MEIMNITVIIQLQNFIDYNSHTRTSSSNHLGRNHPQKWPTQCPKKTVNTLGCLLLSSKSS